MSTVINDIGDEFRAFSLLPAPAQERYFAIAALADENRAVIGVMSDRREEARQKNMVAMSSLDRVQRTYPDHDPEDERQAVAKARAESERLNLLYESRSAQMAPVFRVHSNLNKYLTELSSQIGFPAAASAFKIILVKTKAEKGLSAADAACRVDELRADLHAVESAPIPSKMAKAIAKRHVEALVEAGRPNFLGTVEEGAAPHWNNIAYAMRTMGQKPGGDVGIVVQSQGQASAETGPIPVTTTGHGVLHGIEVPPLAIMAWFDPDRMLKAFEAEIDRLSDDANALDDATRARKIMELKARILEAQRAEVAAIDRERGDFSYREGTDPQAILGIAIDHMDDLE